MVTFVGNWKGISICTLGNEKKNVKYDQLYMYVISKGKKIYI